MRLFYLIRSLGILFSFFSLTMLPPMVVSKIYHEETIMPFMISFCFVLSLGLLCWIPTKNLEAKTHPKDGFLLVVLFWLSLGLIGSIPFILSVNPKIAVINAIFESISGITATGATILTNIDLIPKSLLYYRQQLQFLGGIGIILLAIAVLPALGIGGMQLFKAETSGAEQDNKLTPKIAHAAKSIWIIYVVLTAICAISYWACGMDLFDAIGYSFGTISTGGYTTHDSSMAFFQQPKLQFIAVIFMFLGAVNFSLHLFNINQATFKYYWHSAECRTFTAIIIIATTIITYTLYKNAPYDTFFETFTESLFHVVSFCTTTGFANTNYYSWPLFLPVFLLLLGLIGGCSGSTSGGIKIVRLMLLNIQGYRELKKIVHPNAHYVIKFGKTPVSDRIVNAIWGYLATYIALFGIFLLMLLATGLDFITAYSATAAALSNIGAGLGDVANNYQSINDTAKLLLSFAMLIGRLELFTVLILLTPVYWRS